MADRWDDDALVDLLRTAAPTTTPAPGFDHADVLAGSRRAAARRSRVLLAAAATAVVVALGTVVGVAGLVGGAEQEAASSAAADGAAREGAPEAQAPLLGSPTRPAPGSPAQPVPTEDSVPEAEPGPSTGSTAGACGEVDPLLRAALATVLPEVAGQQPFPLAGCPPGAGSAGVLVRADGVVGTLEVTLAPVGVTARPDGARGPTAAAVTPDGRTLTVQAVPSAGSAEAPYADTLGVLAEQLAAAV